MCIGVPVQVVDGGELTTLTPPRRNGDEQVTMLLVGEQPAGTWVLNFLGWAREVISEQDATSHQQNARQSGRDRMNGAVDRRRSLFPRPRVGGGGGLMNDPPGWRPNTSRRPFRASTMSRWQDCRCSTTR